MKNLIGKMDYTLLNTEATEKEIVQLCKKAHELGVKSVCVRPNMVNVAKKALFKSDVLVCTVVSFPKGTDTTEQKLEEAKKCIVDGADEVDMVLNYTILKETSNTTEPDDDLFYSSVKELISDVKSLVSECHKHTNKNGEQITLKVIVESGLLSDDETENATHICLDAGADFIKTSTGYASNKIGAELHKIQTMKKIIDESHSHMKIKASGGIRTMEDLQKFEPYVDRFGVGFSAVDQIFDGEEKTINEY